MKKLISIVLVVVMLFGILPLSSFGGLTITASATENTNTAGDKITWKISGSVLTLSGSGKMADYSSGTGCDSGDIVP